jgi:hypothetical protein
MTVRRVLAAAVAAIAVAGLAIAAGSATATAATGGSSAFARQAAAAGLTTAQESYLQARIDDVLASTPSARQLSANTIEIAGHRLAIGAPGQRTVRALGLSPAATAATGACPHLWLCTFHNGTALNYYDCTTIYLSNWTGLGYILNNQSTGTISYFYRLDRSVYIKDVAPDKVNREVNWDPIWSFKVC